MRSRADIYRQKADECERAAARVANPQVQASYRQMCRQWHEMAFGGARTRAGSPCRQAAVNGRARCRMHGGGEGVGRTARCAEWQFQARPLDHREQAHTQRNRRPSSRA
jgi:hypothetical protein